MKYGVCPLFVLLLSAHGTVAQHLYATEKGVISFFAEAPVADVDARNENVGVELNTSTHELTFNVKMADFVFSNRKMGRDADKKYLERERFPAASFKGKIQANIDYDKSGKYPATVTGTLKVHGKGKEITETGTISVQDNKITLQSVFNVALMDFGIETPQILGKEMTAGKVRVEVNATLSPQTGLAREK